MAQFPRDEIDDQFARLLGVKVNQVYVFSWGVAGLLSGAAACLLAPIQGSLTPFSLTTALLSALAGAVIGLIFPPTIIAGAAVMARRIQGGDGLAQRGAVGVMDLPDGADRQRQQKNW